jgi:Domain of Unknown Function (DUF1080)
MAVHELSTHEWRGYRRKEFPEGSWSVDANVMRAVAAAERVDLISRRRYRNFALSLEWCLPPGGNSGILYRVSEELLESWQSGPEMQLLDDENHPDSENPRTSCGALYALLAPSKKEVLAVRTFHSARVVARGTYVEHWMNEQKVLSYDLADEGLRELIAKSKFKAYPQFAQQEKGHIVLGYGPGDVSIKRRSNNRRRQ